MELGQPGGNPYAGIGSAVKKTTKAVKKATKPSGRSHYSGGGGSSRSYSGGGGGGSRSYSGGGGGGGGSYSAPKVSIPSIAKYLGTDSAYQTAVSGGKRTLHDFISDITRRRGEAGTQYNQTLSGMERDRGNQLNDMRQEFASRGIINSGLFADAEGKFQTQYTDQLNALKQQQAGLLADLLSQQNNAQREYELALQQAKQEALARRAAQYNVG